MTDRKRPPSLEDLEARLRAARAQGQDPPGDGNGGGGRANASGLGLGMRIAVELVAGVMVGVGIGWALDAWLGTAPWLMVLFLFLGAAAGVMNVYRAAQGLDESVGLGQAQRRRDERRGKEEEGGG